jgi:anti-anti-sigma factor
VEIRQDVQDGVTVLAPSGRIDSTTSGEFERAVGRAIDGGSRRLVIDFAGVNYISSAGLRVLLVTAKRLGGGRGALALSGMNEGVRQVFDLAGFLPLFAVASSREGAVAKATA